eukprot:15304692-Alexandrium_andersonii.AAC.1
MRGRPELSLEAPRGPPQGRARLELLSTRSEVARGTASATPSFARAARPAVRTCHTSAGVMAGREVNFVSV